MGAEPLRQPGTLATPLTVAELDVVASRHRAAHGSTEYLLIHPDCDLCLVLYTARVLYARKAS